MGFFIRLIVGLLLPWTANAAESDLLVHQALLAENGERDIPKAIDLYRQALKASDGLSSTTGPILLHLASCYENLSQFQEALWIDHALVLHATSMAADVVQQAQANAVRLEAKMASALNARDTRAIFAGGHQSAAVLRDGSVLWWGDYPELGQSGRPVLLEHIAGAASVSLGEKSLWVIDQDGNLLGDDCAPAHPCSAEHYGFQPNALTSPKDNVLMAVGVAHNLLLLRDGTVWSWGANRRGQIGNDSLTDQPVPTPINGLTGVISVAAGHEHSVALKGDGTVWCWGTNEQGQLGIEAFYPMVPHPKPVPGLTSMTAIAAGFSHTVALRSDGTVWSWGDNRERQLGVSGCDESFQPVQVPSLLGVTAVAAGPNYTLALKSNGTIWAWGDNSTGALGIGDTRSRHEPVQVAYLMNVESVTAGAGHNLAMTKEGTVWAWGLNDKGQLGDGTTTNRLTPVKISASLKPDL